MTDHRRKYDGESKVGGGGDHWSTAVTRPPPRRPNNKKFTAFRRFGNNSRPEAGPDNRTLSPSTRHYESQPPFRRGNEEETCETIEWEVMSKHFARISPFINENVDKLKNNYPKSNLPQNHHLQYYGDLHKLHQVAYATRNTPGKKLPPSIQQQQPCCKLWQWNPYGNSPRILLNMYALSDPTKYSMHAKNVILDDSRVKLDNADQLSLSVWCKYIENRQSESVYDTKMIMWCRLSALIKSQMPWYGLYMVGSTMNGFGVDVSDSDFCLLTGCATLANVKGGSNDGQCQEIAANDERYRICGVQRLRWLMGLLEHERLNSNFLASDVRIIYAKVPILRFRWTDDSGDKMDVDLCCNNVVGIRNTHLLYCYSRLDYRVRPLVLTIKLWASRHNINDPKKMTLSSYSLVLMVINFLQCVKPPVVPSLQQIYGMKFSADTNIEFVHMHEQLPCSGWKSDNNQSLGELLLEFFRHYNDFNYYKYAVSVRVGAPVFLEHCRMVDTIKNDPGQWKFIGIEEPFERTNTARSVHNPNVFAQIKEVINKSYNKLKETKSLDSIFCQFVN